MAYLKFSLSRDRLRKLNTFLIIIHVLSLMISFGLIVAAIRIKSEVGDYINMISRNDGHLLPAILALVAMICISVNGFGLFMTIKSRSFPSKSRLNIFLFIYVIVTSVTAVSIIASIVLCGLHTQNFQKNLHDSITTSMKEYGNDISVKIKIDKLQINFECCGSKSYKEWFTIPWFDPNLGGVAPIRNSEFVSDDVPFSCCAGGALLPCIHHGIMSSNPVYRYDPQRQFSVSNTGCHGALVIAARNLLAREVVVLLALSFIQAIISLGSRVLQTALSIRVVGYGSVTHIAWIFGRYRQQQQPLRKRSSSQLITTTHNESTTELSAVEETES